MTDEEHAMIMATTMSLAEAHLFLNPSDSDTLHITLPEGVPPLDYRKGPSA